MLRAFIVLQFDPADDTSMYHVLNDLTRVEFIDESEFETACTMATSLAFSIKPNTLPAWRRILGKDVPDTIEDIELLGPVFRHA